MTTVNTTKAVSVGLEQADEAEEEIDLTFRVSGNAPQGDGESDFHIHDEHTANWLVRQVVEARAYADRVRQWAKDEVRRAERSEEKLMYLFGDQLRKWCTDELTARGGRLRSLHLPAGQLGFRRQPERLVVRDEAELARWCRQQCEDALVVVVEGQGAGAKALMELVARETTSLIVKQRLQMAEVMATMRETGELPPGTQTNPENNAFFIR
jgi:hypothetical protein